ncbi:alpha/beta hydrolase [Paraburkholderia sp. MMS20-SJTR3]|uniref:Alpha/beta hydrolase n=1 Tax=Paraburkholderia sejongensis TaxID=2886946 RepID=A0ABS8K0Q3_9BURK|nr:alpha/beta hydrolase [Paraburkholderia sp. MMS20-SJTR3]MCC8395731.1 alpha/beta hydrolase [Paraburkholderia sp. MMS20-SJTR3]
MPFDLTFADLAERAVQYNARASVSDFDAEMAIYASLARDSRERCAGILDLRYGMGQAERIDIFPGVAAARPAPLFVFIHGGYWRSQRKEDACSMAAAFTAAGVAVAMIEYTLLPEATLAEVVREVRSAIAWLYQHGGAYGIDTQRIYICGSSAGAHLAGMLYADDWQRRFNVPQDLIKGVVGLSGLYDIRPLCEIGVNEWLRLYPDQAALLSPALCLPNMAPPLLLTVGGLETTGFRNQTLQFHEDVSRRGLPVTLVPNTHSNHFNLVNELAEPESALFQAVLRMIRGA